MVRELVVTPRNWQVLPATELEEIMQNVLMILLTPKYSAPLDRELGISASMIDAPINTQSRLTAEIAAAIKTFEPRARLKSISFTGDYRTGEVKPVAVLEIGGG